MQIDRRSFMTGAAAAPLAAALPAAAEPQKIVRVAMSATNMNTLDPRKTIQNVDQFGSRQIFDALLDPPDGTFDLAYDQVMRELAEDFTISPDAKLWTLKLRRGVQFHRNFGEMTADDVRFTYAQMLDTKFGSPERAFLGSLASVDALDPYTVRFTLNRPDPTFHASSLISLVGAIVSRKAYEAAPDAFSRTPVGSGPFAFDHIDTDRGIVLNAFDAYFGGRPKIDGMEIRYMADPTARTLSFIKGDLDVIEGARLPGWIAQVRQQKPDAILDATHPGSCNTLYFNMGRRPFDDIRVRKALRYAIDRNVILTAFNGSAGPAWGINPPEFSGAFQKDEVPAELRYDYDPDRAKALLNEAGLGRGFRFSIIMTPREDYASLMLMVQEMWRQVGVDMTMQTVDHTSYHTQMAHDVNAVIMNSESFAPVLTQIPFANYAATAEVKPDGSGGENYSHYGVLGGGIDDLLNRAMGEPSLQARQELVRKLELKILADMPAFTLCTLSFIYMRNPRVNIGFEVKGGYARYRFAKTTIA